MLFQHGYEYFYRFFIYENLMTDRLRLTDLILYYYLPVLALGTFWYLPLYFRLIRSFRREWLPLLFWVAFV
ncbi:MAG: glycosyltransferase family 39 protein, partial [Aquificaceae bacterium]